ncbi:MAG: hypothetical protein RLZ25_1344 [Pseudomonadota bacterium]
MAPSQNDPENFMSNPSRQKPLILALLVTAGFAGGYALRTMLAGDTSQPAPLIPAPSVPTTAAPAPIPAPETPRIAADFADFAVIAAGAGPAVVNISTRVDPAKVKQEAEANPPEAPEGDDPFLPFFGPQESPKNPMPQEGMGSGFIVRGDGVVLTNAHVVNGATEVTVKLQDRREFTAKVIGVDKLSDTAVLKIEGNNLPVVPIGNPNTTRVGEWVMAIGSPFGFENTVTAGIVSAKARSLPEEGYVPFIQTDVAVNPGNSGGPLLNTQGEVIGINSQIYTSSGGYQGLSFAIPIDVALEVERQILEKGRVTRGRIGVSVQDLSQGLAESFGLEKPEGALVGMVPQDGPGAKAGIKPGDVILALNNEKVIDSRELPPKVAILKPGTEAVLKIWRDGKAMDLKVTIAELDDTPKPEAAPKSEAKAQKPGRLGLAIRPLSPEERQKHGVEGGLMIEKAVGPAQKAGILKGDVLLALNGELVSDVETLKKLSDKAGAHVALLIERQGNTLFIPLTLGKEK